MVCYLIRYIISELVDPTKAQCGQGVMVARERWEMEPGIILNTPQYCELCLCICDDPLSASARYQFSTKATGATPKDIGYVVTGLRFRRIGNIFSLQVSCGKSK